MVNAVFAKMDTYQKYGGQESLDLMKLYGGSQSDSRATSVASSRTEANPARKQSVQRTMTEADSQPGGALDANQRNSVISTRSNALSTSNSQSLEVTF